MKKIVGNRYVQAIAVAILSIIFMYAGAIIGLLFEIPFDLSGNSIIKFAGEYFNFIGIWIVIIGFCLIRKKNRPLLAKLGKGGAGNNWKTILIVGLSCGIGINLLVAIVAMIHGDIALSFSEFNPLYILLFIVVIAIQSGAEEVAYRFYVYQKIAQLFPDIPLLPMIVNAAVFSYLHGNNPGVTPLALANIVLVGILYSLIIYYFDSFWACVVAHTSWNFCQNILLGLPNSGIVSQYSIFKLDASTAMDSFAYNVNFGIESTILSSVLLAAACVVIIVVGRKRRAQAAK